MTGRPNNWLTSAYIDAARAERTRVEYAKYWRRFEHWCSLHDRVALPATPETVASYILARVDDGDRISTIRARLAAIAATHVEASEEKPTRDPDIHRLLRGISRSQATETPSQVTPLTAQCMHHIEMTANLDRPIERENLAICWVMRDAMLRRSEAAALLWADIAADEDGTGTLLIRRSKTDQSGTGHVAFLSADAMRALARIRPQPATGHVFPYHPHTIERRIKQQAKRAGLPGRFRGHSPRVGMSVDLATAGAGVVEMQQAGRWRSPNMPAMYARAAQAKRGAVAKFYGGEK